MKICPAALPVLILAVALGPPAHASLLQRSRGPGVHHRGDCCLSYTQIIQCIFLSYYETSRECQKPGIVLLTKEGIAFCGHPDNNRVKECIEDVEMRIRSGNMAKRSVEEKLD